MKFLNLKIIILVLTFLVAIGGLFVFFDKSDEIEDATIEVASNEIDNGAYLFDMGIDGLDLKVDLANTIEKRSTGLSGRKKLKENQGMFFVFDSPGFYSFWMKDMNFPIDIIWIGKDLKIVDVTENIPPDSFPRKYGSDQMTQYVLEVNSGWVQNHKIEIGMKVSLDNIFPDLKIQEEIPTDAVEEPQQVSPNLLERDLGTEVQEPTGISGSDLSGKSQIILFDVPFTSQAPFGGWSDPRRENACEETSALMAMAWVRGEKLTAEYSDKKILEISDYEKEVYGDFHDTSAEDTVKRIFNDYFKYAKVRAVRDIDIEDIKRELRKGNLVIVPVHGQRVKNPYYTPPGPVQHMMVVVGYDESKKQFITNDPGTRHGEKYRYDEVVFGAALQDYPSGMHEPIIEGKTAMIVVEK